MNIYHMNNFLHENFPIYGMHYLNTLLIHILYPSLLELKYVICLVLNIKLNKQINTDKYNKISDMTL